VPEQVTYAAQAHAHHTLILYVDRSMQLQPSLVVSRPAQTATGRIRNPRVRVQGRDQAAAGAAREVSRAGFAVYSLLYHVIRVVRLRVATCHC
jgi:hypothetical protein